MKRNHFLTVACVSAVNLLIGCDNGNKRLGADWKGFADLTAISSTKQVQISNEFDAVTVRDEKNGTHIFLIKGSQIVLCVSPFGNGQNITVACGNKPAVHVTQNPTTISVGRSIYGPNEMTTCVLYNDIGEIEARNVVTK